MSRISQRSSEIVTEQDALAERVFDAIDDLGGLPDTGEFPMEFTDTHDLSIDYMMREAVGYCRQDVADLEAAAATPNLAPQAAPLVERGGEHGQAASGDARSARASRSRSV